MFAIHNKSSKKKPRIVVCSSKGLLAGDLTALLAHDYQVERVMTVPSYKLAMEKPVQGLIVFKDNTQFCQPESLGIDNLVKQGEVRVLVFGTRDGQWSKVGSRDVRFFSQVPDCNTILAELNGLRPREKESSS